MGTRRLNPKARRYLLTGQREPPAFGLCFGRTYLGGRRGVQTNVYPSRTFQTVIFFPDVTSRDGWVRFRPSTRAAVGKRHPAVKEFRRRANAGRTC